MGKLLERMLVERLKWHLIPKMSQKQYGFMPQKSTEDALYDLMSHIKSRLNNKEIVVMISLDIEGAFDSAWWPALRVRLAEEGCPINLRRLVDHYLKERAVKVQYAGEECTKNTNKGCVQGSIGGPLLWNLLLDPLLKKLEDRQTYVQAFADDVVLIFNGQSTYDITLRAEEALSLTAEWGVRNKLKFAPHKTKAMVITKKLKYDTPRLNMGGVEIQLVDHIKILGLTIDQKLTFNNHIHNICTKAMGIYKQLSRAAKIGWGLHPEVTKTIYKAVVEPVILYAASAWAPSANKLSPRKQLNALQRGFAQKITLAYRTVSLHSALALAGMIPLDLRIKEAASLYATRKGYIEITNSDKEIERPIQYDDFPHPTHLQKLTFTCLNDQEQTDATNDLDLHIYTDGSKIEGKVGAALSLWQNGHEKTYRKLSLATHCTVYQAELLAICRATKMAVEGEESRIGILSDSRAALETICNRATTNRLAHETRENLALALRKNKSIDLFWIKAHAGLEGNERADVLAKEAALKSKRRPDFDLCPVSFAKRQIRIETIGEWNDRYTRGDTAATTKIFLPDIPTAHKFIKRNTTDGILTQILTGHGGFAEYLYRFKCRDSPLCECDDNTDETIVHALVECPVHMTDRHNLENETNEKINRQNLTNLLTDKTNSNKFLEYSKKIAIKLINKNSNNMQKTDRQRERNS